MFDGVNLLQSPGFDTVRQRSAEWLASFQGPIGYEIRHLEFTAGGEVAFSHRRNHVNAVRPDGTRFDMW